MLPAFLAAFFFALNATCATHSLRAFGPVRANLGRLGIATLILGAFAHALGHGFNRASLPWFLLSGVIGMELGDLAVFAALPLLGSRLTVLLTQCLDQIQHAAPQQSWELVGEKGRRSRPALEQLIAAESKSDKLPPSS